MLKIKHNISLQEDERTLSGRILEVQFLDGAERGEWESYDTKDEKFFVSSNQEPELIGKRLFVWWALQDLDNQKVSYTYSSKEEALKVLDYINEFSIKEVTDEYWYAIQQEIHLPNELEINGITYIRK